MMHTAASPKKGSNQQLSLHTARCISNITYSLPHVISNQWSVPLVKNYDEIWMQKNTTTEKRASVRFWAMAVKGIGSRTISYYLSMNALIHDGLAANLRPQQGSAKLIRLCTDMPAHMRLWMVGWNEELQDFCFRVGQGLRWVVPTVPLFINLQNTPISESCITESWATHDFAIAELCNSLDPLPAMCSNLSVRSHIPYLSQFPPATVHKSTHSSTYFRKVCQYTVSSEQIYPSESWMWSDATVKSMEGTGNNLVPTWSHTQKLRSDSRH